MVSRGEVYWLNLDPVVGSKICRTRPAVVVSPSDMNRALPRVIVAPLTSKGQAMKCRPEVTFNGKAGRILLDPIRCIDKKRLAGKLGEIDLSIWLAILLEMLA